MKMLDVPQSGSIAGQTSSRNRYGQYRRTRAIPVNPSSSHQQAVRTRVQTNSAAWRALSDGQRAGWTDLGNQITRTDSLGQTYTLTGFQAYVLVNQNNLNAGDSVVSDAPGLILPDPILTLTPTTTGGTLSVAFTPTPLGAAERIFIYASPQRSAGRSFEGDLRLVSVSGAAGTSPINMLSAYSARFGAPVEDNRIFFSAVRYAGGFVSTPINTSTIVVA